MKVAVLEIDKRKLQDEIQILKDRTDCSKNELVILKSKLVQSRAENLQPENNENTAQLFSQRMLRDKRFKEQVISEICLSAESTCGKVPERSPSRNPLQVIKDDGNSPLRSLSSASIKISELNAVKSTISGNDSNETTCTTRTKKIVMNLEQKKVPGSSIISRLRSRFNTKA